MKNFIIFFIILFRALPLFSGYIGLHTITTDGSVSDWVANGTFNSRGYNTAWISNNQYIWKDGYNDDKGNGYYVYPTNAAFNDNSADIDKFSVCWDTNYLYLMVKLHNSTAWKQLSAFFIGIDTGTPKSGMYTFIEGDGADSATGPAVELVCANPRIDFLLFGCANTQARLWNKAGILIGDGRDGSQDGGNNNIYLKAGEWNKYEIAIPLSLLNGIPTNSTWKYIVGSGFTEDDIFREAQGFPLNTEWYFTGGDDTWYDDVSVDPDVCDLIGADKSSQESDLGNFTASGSAGDTNFFTKISSSYVTIGDYNKFYIRPTSINVDENKEVPLTIMGCNSVSTGEFIGKPYTIGIYGGVGRVENNIFYSTSIDLTNSISGYITFSISGITTYTLSVKVSASFSKKLLVQLSKQFLNPWDNKVTLTIDMGKAEKVEVRIYTISGQLVKTIEKTLSGFDNKIDWYRDTDDLQKVGSGLYIIKITRNDETISKKIILVN